MVTPQATYRRRTKDLEFQRVYSAGRESTLVDEYRCFQLWNLVEQSSKLERGALIEIGAWRGGTGVLIAVQAARCGIEDALYLCDTFQGVVKAGPMDSAYEGGEHADTTLQVVEDLLRRMSLRNVRILSAVVPDETGGEVADNEVGCVKQRAERDGAVLPVYCNDAEIFDHRPGRFAAESRLHTEKEWVRFKRVGDRVHTDLGLDWLSPTAALRVQTSSSTSKARRLTSVSQPIPVKKQAKYNINRWGGGRQGQRVAQHGLPPDTSRVGERRQHGRRRLA